MTRLIEPILRTFGRRILFVLSIAVALALLVTAAVVSFLADREARLQAERRFRTLANGALLEMILGEGRDVEEELREMKAEMLVTATVSATGETLAVARDEFERVAQTADVFNVDFLYEAFRAPGFAAVAPDGRAIWNKVNRNAEPGESWTRFAVVSSALAGTMITVVRSPQDADVPPILPGADPSRLFLVTAVPMERLRPTAGGAWIVANAVSQEDLDGFAEATGVEVELSTPTARLRTSKLAGAPDGFTSASGERLHLREDVYWARTMIVETPGGVPVATATLYRPITDEVRLVRRIWSGISIVFVLALFAGVLLGRVFAAPLSVSVQKLVEGTEAFRLRRYGHRVQVATKDELAVLADSLNAMAEQLEKGEFIERTMRISVPRKYLDYILQHRDELGLDGALRDVTVLFCDLGGFTHFAEGKDPAEVVKLINDYFDVCTRVIETHDGMVDKFIGDAVMGIWNAPVAVADHPGKALVAALELASATEYVIAGWRSPERLRIRVGVHSGPAVAGHIGARAHQQPYSVVGDTVNLANRLEGASKIYRTRVLTTRATRERAGDAVEARFVDRVRMKGRDEPVELYEVLCEKGSPVPPRAPEAGYRAAWELYASKRFAEAADAFTALSVAYPEDGPAETMAARCVRYARNAPDDFDSVFPMDQK